MQRIYLTSAVFFACFISLSLLGDRLLRSQEPAPDADLSRLEELLSNPADEDDIADFAPDTEGYLIKKRCWVENLVENRAVLAFERPGVLEYVEARAGDIVEEGMVVAHLKDDVARSQHAINLKEAANTVDKRYAQKAFEVARAKWEGAVNVNQKIDGTIPEIEIRELQLDAQRAELQIEQAQHKQEIAVLTAEESATQLKTFNLKAPFTGTVTKVHNSKGEAVNQGDPVIELLNIDTVRVNGFVPRDLAHQIRQGDRVVVQLLLKNANIRFPGSDKVLEGKIQFIDLKTVGLEGYVQVSAEVINDDNLLLPGSSVAMKIVK